MTTTDIIDKIIELANRIIEKSIQGKVRSDAISLRQYAHDIHTAVTLGEIEEGDEDATYFALDSDPENTRACVEEAARNGYSAKEAERCDDYSVGCQDCPFR